MIHASRGGPDPAAAPAGDVDYSIYGQGYSEQSRADPRIEAFIRQALGDAKTVLNIGAGAGSYEPTGRHVIAIEPSAAMRAQRAAHRVPAIIGVAEERPLNHQSVDASYGRWRTWPHYEGSLQLIVSDACGRV